MPETIRVKKLRSKKQVMTSSTTQEQEERAYQDSKRHQKILIFALVEKKSKKIRAISLLPRQRISIK